MPFTFISCHTVEAQHNTEVFKSNHLVLSEVNNNNKNQKQNCQLFKKKCVSHSLINFLNLH